MITRLLKNILANKMCQAFKKNNDFISKIITEFGVNRSGLKCLDIGCGTGENTRHYFSGLSKPIIHGVDLQGSRGCESFLKFYNFNFEKSSLPFERDYFDIVVSNQVIEHVLDKDYFLNEVCRTLKKGGLYIISTENISSLDNIVSLIIGNEPLCQHSSSKYIISSVFSPHYMDQISDPSGNQYMHKNVLSYYTLKRLAIICGLNNGKIISFGGAPLFEKIAPIYNRIITIYGVQ